MRALAATLVLAACGSASPVGSVRFAAAPPVLRVNDRLDVPKKPHEIPFLRWFYDFSSYYDAAVRGLRLEQHRRALGVNALDEVPDSTWFTNRIGVRDVSLEEIQRGPAQAESPELHKPWTIKSSKIGGTVPGFICEDAAGTKFLLKFDQQTVPEIETAADAISGRLLWAAGWNVPTDYVVHFDRADLVLGKDATHVSKAGKRPLLETDVEATLLTLVGPNVSRIRALASVYLAGKPVGGMPLAGTRDDDPNDRIPHERRRDQRGFATFAAWLGHNDLKFDNTLDMWQEDPADPRRHYVVHYAIDFGKALGAMAKIDRRPYSDVTYRIDLGDMIASLFTLGVHQHGWEHRQDPGLRGVGMFTAGDYVPDEFKPNNMTYLPVRLADRFDQFWAAKLMIRFSRTQLAAAIDAGQLSDPASAAYLLQTLIDRQRMTAAHWFSKVTPVDELAVVAGSRLCFTDLSVRHGLVRTVPSYRADVFRTNGAKLGSGTVALDRAGRGCVDAVPLSSDPDRYTVVRLTSSQVEPPVLVHLALVGGTLRVIGIDRR